ncbi:MAG: tRNA (adenosine(37)-N6)-threonylcarbamoyltransferase complex dimerization subunit type 1 TsaB [Spirochaetota bacterium]
MNILGIDTSTDYLCVALRSGEQQFESFYHLGFKHSEHLLPEIEHLLSKAGLTPSELDLIVCTRGPGSFTGLRIGMSTAKGLACGSNTPLVSVTSLLVFARYGQAEASQVLLPVIDARKKRYYATLITQGVEDPPLLDSTPEELLEHIPDGSRVTVTGPDADTFCALVTEKNLASLLERKEVLITPDPSANRSWAGALLELGISQYRRYGADSPTQGPLYLRKSEAEIGITRQQ